MTLTHANMQVAPFPDALQRLVGNLRYIDGWKFTLREMIRDPAATHGYDSHGLTLVIVVQTPDSYDNRGTIAVQHNFPVPPATYDERSWRRWLFEQIMLVHRHEAMEFFRLRISIDTYDRPYAPSHGPGNDPYMVREVGTETDVATSFRGEVKS